jgi:uncharacterized protein
VTTSKPTVSGIYVNLPVADLQRSITFWTALGFSFNPQFTDETATCLMLGETHSVMLLTHAKFQGFTPLPIGDAFKATQVLTALSLGSRDEVDALFASVVANGGKAFRPTEDLGFMYTRSFTDPDGHAWEPFYMDMSAFPGAGG